MQRLQRMRGMTVAVCVVAVQAAVAIRAAEEAKDSKGTVVVAIPVRRLMEIAEQLSVYEDEERRVFESYDDFSDEKERRH